MGGSRINQCHAASCAQRANKRKKRQQFIRDLPWIIGAFVLLLLMSSTEGLVEHLF